MTHGALALITGLLAAPPVHAAPRAPDSLGVALHALPGSSLTIRGSTTVGSRWRCTGQNVVTAATLDSSSTSVLSIRTVTIAVPVATLRCQSAAMDRAMRRALKFDRDSSASIVGEFAAQAAGRVHPSRAGTTPLAGWISVAGVKRSVALDVVVEPMAGGPIRVRSTIPLALSSFGISRPRVLLGLVRARDAITVEVDLRYAPDATGHDNPLLLRVTARPRAVRAASSVRDRQRGPTDAHGRFHPHVTP